MNGHWPFSLGCGNGSKCPFAVTRCDQPRRLVMHLATFDAYFSPSIPLSRNAGVYCSKPISRSQAAMSIRRLRRYPGDALSRSAVMLNPRNLRSSGRATALFASLTFSRSFLVRNRLTEVITRSPARRLRT